MKKNKESQIIELLRELFSVWIYRLGLRWWFVNINYVTNKKQIKRMFPGRESETVLARTYADWRYVTASIYVNIPACSRMSKSAAKNLVIHELTHILINEMREEGIEHEERVCTSLANAFIWTAADVEKKEE